MTWLPLNSAKIALPAEQEVGSLLGMLGRKTTSWAIRVNDNDGTAKVFWCGEPTVTGLADGPAILTACRDFELNKRFVPGWSTTIAVEANPESLVSASEIAWYDARGLVMLGPNGPHICAYDKFADQSMRYVDTTTWTVDSGLREAVSRDQYSVAAYFSDWRIVVIFGDERHTIGRITVPRSK